MRKTAGRINTALGFLTGCGKKMAIVIAVASLAALSGCGTVTGGSSAGTGSSVNTDSDFSFSNIVTESDDGYTTVFGEVNNATNERYSFNVQVSFYDKDDNLLGTASGVVNGLNGGDTKIFTAITTGNYSNASSCKAEVESINSIQDNEESPIEFSDTASTTTSGMTQVDGTAKNTDTEAHSFTIIASFYDENGNLIGIASGAVTDLGAGETADFTAYSTDDYSGAASFKVALDTMVS